MHTSMLPTLPQPPTDNLYKFCAIIGVIIAAASIVLPGRELIDLANKAHDLSRQIAVAEVEAEMDGEKVRQLKELIDNSIAAQNGESVVSKRKLALHYSEEELKKLFVQADDMHRTGKIRLVELRSLNEWHRRSLWIIGAVLIVAAAGLFTGVRLALFGFGNWLEKVQRPSDEALLQDRHNKSKRLGD